ncbi:hypothetical protein GCM10025865_20890 [Paraoerskovia sediminicola]|uniref:Glycosyl hydrolase family 13 catalytic domain-containing protein n=1 Tax=Paraoerskovia sediminicola TaxID=1138587 RepID=A0ABN6XDL7_9CELL|nr:hypothetical protein GCM10025865_20890 [Paraoerskovia sediminicola]
MPDDERRGRVDSEIREQDATVVSGSQAQWWRSAVIYQVYPRSFADGNGDGTGDLAGVRKHLTYLRDLGVDAIWFTPWYLSPLADGGYDVQDYRTIDPAFGTLEEAEALISEARELGIRTIIDVVPNHISSEHEWFRAALAAAPGSPERERFWFHDGLGPDGDEMPTQWVSSFQGNTWTRTTDPDGTPGQWYLHLFTPEQPDLNWSSDDVRREHEDVLRFWFDRGPRGSGSTPPRCRSRTPSSRPCPRSSAPASTRTSTATSCTTSTAGGVPSPTPTRTPGCSSARSGSRTSSGSPCICVPTRCTRPSTSTS